MSDRYIFTVRRFLVQRTHLAFFIAIELFLQQDKFSNFELLNVVRWSLQRRSVSGV